MLNDDDNPMFSVFGIGIWHREDSSELTGMFDFQNVSASNHHRLSRAKPPEPKNVHLFNLANAVRSESGEEDPGIGTTRIVRIYRVTTEGKTEFGRVDWELEGGYDEKHRPPMRELDTEKTQKFLNNLKYSPNPPSSTKTLPFADPKSVIVVLKDLRRGVVCPAVIEWLRKEYARVPWFVSTKAWKPDWLSLLKDVNLQVLLIPQVAAKGAIESGDVRCWITGAGYPDESAIEAVDSLYRVTVNEKGRDKFGSEYRPRIIVLPEGYRVLARDSWDSLNNRFIDPATQGSANRGEASVDPKVRDAHVQERSEIGPLRVDMGMASVFLPALIAHLAQPQKHPDLKELTESALLHTYRWVHYEGRRIIDPRNWIPDQVFTRVEGELATNMANKTFSWDWERDLWRDAMDDLPVVRVASLKDVTGGFVRVRYVASH